MDDVEDELKFRQSIILIYFPPQVTSSPKELLQQPHDVENVIS